MLDEIIAEAPLYFLVAVRALAMIETAPLLSSDAVPQVAKVALAGFAAFAALGSAPTADWAVPAFSLAYILLVIGEGLIGIIMGFYLTMVYSAFASAGQFFSLQMGLSASETYDPLAQIENPIMGQYLNLIGMLVFITNAGFQKMFLGGFLRSLQSLSSAALIAVRERFLQFLLSGLSRMFLDALVISLPILGTLFIVSVAMGLLSKAAPQMNLMTEGFPLTITVAYAIILATMPFLVEAFVRVIDNGFSSIGNLWSVVGQI